MARHRHRRPTLGVLTVAGVLTAWGPAPAEAREQRVVAIGGHELAIALADGDCFFDADQPADRGLIDQLPAATGAEFIPLLAFGGCNALAGWRAGDPPVLPRFGYVMIAEAHLESVFAFDQATLADAIAQALADRGAVDYRADIGRLAADLERVWPALPAGGKQELGIVHRDRHGPVLASVLSVPGPGASGTSASGTSASGGGAPTPRVMLHQSVLVAGKLLNVVAARDYRDSESIFEAYGDLSAVVEATTTRNRQ